MHGGNYDAYNTSNSYFVIHRQHNDKTKEFKTGARRRLSASSFEDCISCVLCGPAQLFYLHHFHGRAGKHVRWPFLSRYRLTVMCVSHAETTWVGCFHLRDPVHVPRWRRETKRVLH